MSIVLYKRSFREIFWGIVNRILHMIAYVTFPSHVTTFLHRLRGVKIGKGSKISRSVHIDDSYPSLVEIGKEVWVTAGVEILCHERDLSYYKFGKAVKSCLLKKEKVIIKDGAHIGIGAIILPGVTIGKGSVIGAGAVVTSDIPDYCVAVGVPAKVIKTFKEENIENLD